MTEGECRSFSFLGSGDNPIKQYNRQIMKTIICIMLVLLPVFVLAGQNGLPNKEPVRDLPAAQRGPTARARAPLPANKPNPGLELQGITVLTLDPACNACRGAHIDLQVHSTVSGPLVLSVGDITSTSGAKNFNAKISVFPLDSSRELEDRKKAGIKAGETLKIRALITGTLDFGTWDVGLLNHGKPFGSFKVVNAAASFNVKPDIADLKNAEITFSADKPSSIRITNEDTIPYVLECVYTIGPVTVPCRPEAGKAEVAWWQSAGEAPKNSTSFKVPAQGSAQVVVTPDPAWFEDTEWLPGFLKDDVKDGQLRVRLRSMSCDSDPAAPVKGFDFKTHLTTHSPDVMALGGFVIVFVTLLAGALVSVLANLLLPGMARRLKVKEELVVLGRRVNDLSMSLDSRVRVSLGVERGRLAKRLAELGTISADFSTVIAEIEKAISGLTARLDLVEKLELFLRKFWRARSDGRLPMTVTREIDDVRQQITDLLGRSEPSDADLQAAQLLIQDLERRLNNVGQPNLVFAQRLVQRLNKMRDAFSQNALAARAVLRDLFAHLPALLAYVQKDVPKPEDIQPLDYVTMDTILYQMEIANRYASLLENPVGKSQAARLNDNRNELLRLLLNSSWDAVNQAGILVQELQENVFPEDVAEAVKDKRVQIEADRNLVFLSEPVGFRLFFFDQRIAGSIARSQFTIQWDFGHDGLTEKGSGVSHFFPYATRLWVARRRQRLWRLIRRFVLRLLRTATRRPPTQPDPRKDPRYLHEPFNLRASLIHPDGTILALAFPKTLDVYKPLPSRSTSFWVEGTRLTIALLLALVGLVAGAKEQLLKLDVFPALVAIFLIGFGANEVKKLFTQNSQ